MHEMALRARFYRYNTLHASRFPPRSPLAHRPTCLRGIEPRKSATSGKQPMDVQKSASEPLTSKPRRVRARDRATVRLAAGEGVTEVDDDAVHGHALRAVDGEGSGRQA